MYLMIDNYDSFVYNLKAYFEELGKEIAVIRCDKITLEEIEDMQPSGIILSPGPKRPQDATLCIVSFGITARVAKNAIAAARAQGIKVGMIRPITLWPFPKAPLCEAAKHCNAFLSVEMNMGQMLEDVQLAIGCSRPVYLCNRVGGMIPAPEQVLAKICEIAKMGGAKA